MRVWIKITPNRWRETGTETCEEADTSDPTNKSSPCDHN